MRKIPSNRFILFAFEVYYFGALLLISHLQYIVSYFDNYSTCRTTTRKTKEHKTRKQHWASASILQVCHCILTVFEVYYFNKIFFLSRSLIVVFFQTWIRLCSLWTRPGSLPRTPSGWWKNAPSLTEKVWFLTQFCYQTQWTICQFDLNWKYV